VLATRERRHEPRLLLIGTEGQDRERRRARVHGNRHSHACIGSRQLFEHEDVRREVRARSTVFLRHADTHQPELGQLAEQIPGKVMVAVPLRGMRIDLSAREVTRKRLDLTLILRQVKVHRTR
jgi:hypothetical protein